MSTQELIHEYAVSLTGLTEFGVSMDVIMSGKPLPAKGARIDVQFAGPLTGGRVDGESAAPSSA